MANIPPIPIKASLTDENGMVTQPWVFFFQQIMTRVGGNTGTSIPDVSTQISTINSEITAINASISSLQLPSLGLNVGRQL